MTQRPKSDRDMSGIRRAAYSPVWDWLEAVKPQTGDALYRLLTGRDVDALASLIAEHTIDVLEHNESKHTLTAGEAR